jgi:hypothetical protein
MNRESGPPQSIKFKEEKINKINRLVSTKEIESQLRTFQKTKHRYRCIISFQLVQGTLPLVTLLSEIKAIFLIKF